ncbi:MAG TPA: hypothetical protein VFF41_04155 [Gallionella sp.]|nr:hypothetical protein [Gallionella sp.]
MKPDPTSLNIKLPPSKFTWRLQRYIILMSAVLSLLAVAPHSIAFAVCAVLIGTPLFWLIFGSNIIFRQTTGMPIVRLVVIATLVYFVAKLLAWAVPVLVKLLAGYGIA